jgi:geranylgeranyl diphosphate synthase type II
MSKSASVMSAPFPAHYLNAIEEALIRLLPPPQTEPAHLHEAMHYCLRAGGKRLRPALVLLGADLYGPAVDPLPAAVAIECLHTYSLVHDDLPAMDDSPLRRGLPAAHVEFGEAMAILTGDALLTEAFRLLAYHYRDVPERAVSLIQCLSTAADSRHLIGGQVLDTLGEARSITAADLASIHQHKTADLITAALQMGLLLGSPPSCAEPLIREIGHCLGVAFQIVDDILDTTATTETIGKPAGNDARHQKNTHVTVHGIDASRAAVLDLTGRAIAACRQLPDADTHPLEALIQFLATRIN